MNGLVLIKIYNMASSKLINKDNSCLLYSKQSESVNTFSLLFYEQKNIYNYWIAQIWWLQYFISEPIQIYIHAYYIYCTVAHKIEVLRDLHSLYDKPFK